MERNPLWKKGGGYEIWGAVFFHRIFLWWKRAEFVIIMQKQTGVFPQGKTLWKIDWLYSFPKMGRGGVIYGISSANL